MKHCETCGTELEMGSNTCTRCGQVQSGTEAPVREHQGIGGWLILYAIGVVSYVVFSGIGLITDVVRFHEASSKPWGIVAIVVDAVLFLLTLWVAYLFFKKASVFPKVIIIITALSMAYQLLIGVVDAARRLANAQNTSQLVINLVVNALWIGYFVRSKRVKATFTQDVPLVPFKH